MKRRVDRLLRRFGVRRPRPRIVTIQIRAALTLSDFYGDVRYRASHPGARDLTCFWLGGRMAAAFRGTVPVELWPGLEWVDA